MLQKLARQKCLKEEVHRVIFDCKCHNQKEKILALIGYKNKILPVTQVH